MYSDRDTKEKEKPCHFYVDNEPLTSYREVTRKLASKEISEKEEGLKTILSSMTNDDNYPQDLMMSAIHSLLIVDDIRIKKLLFLFWEVIEKTNPNGKIKDEFILVVNSLIKDLRHPNEYIRGRTLRLLTKLTNVEILENLKTAVFENLTHNHPYVRSNALMCLNSFINNFGEDVLPDDISVKLRELIEKDNDIATKRNAYLVLAKVRPDESILATEEILSKNEVNELGDLFALAIVENLKNLPLIFPQRKSRFIKLLIDLASHKSHSVLFEIGIALLQLSSNPNTIRQAVTILTNLLVEQRDNNTLIIILKKLIGIKNKYKDILEEQILQFAVILDSNCASELRRLLFELISELIRESNISQVFEIFVGKFNKLKNVTETDTTIEYKNMILTCMFKNIKKIPNLSRAYPLFLLEKCLLYNSKGSFLDEQIMIIRDLFSIYNSTGGNMDTTGYLNDFMNKIISNFEDISNPDILQTCIWILAEVTTDANDMKKVFDIIMKNMGDLNFEYENEDDSSKKNDVNSNKEKKTITKTVILPDGSYGTQTITVDPNEINKKEMKYLRKFILETNYFFTTNLVVALTRITSNLRFLDSEIFKTYYFNCVNIICAALKLNSDKIYKDPDNVARISLCLEFLINDDFEAFNQWIRESKETYDKFYYETLKTKTDNLLKNEKKKVTSVDEFISFRHVRPYDHENFETVEDTNPALELLDKKSHEELTNAESKQNKFIEVLTGTEDPLHVEAIVEVFTFDIVIEFLIKNKTKNDVQSVTVQLFAPTNLDIIEKAPSVHLMAGETRTIRSCIKFSSTSNSYIYGQVNYLNNKGALNYVNLSGIQIELLNTYAADISESNFRKLWVEYNWEHNVLLISKKRNFKEVIENLIHTLNLKLIVPNDINLIDEESVFLVTNLYTKSKLGEDALINISIEKTHDGRIIGTAIIRSRVKEFTIFLGEKIKSLVK